MTSLLCKVCWTSVLGKRTPGSRCISEELEFTIFLSSFSTRQAKLIDVLFYRGRFTEDRKLHLYIGEGRQPWAGISLGPIVFFSKSMKGKILNCLHEVEKMISIISVQVGRKNCFSLLWKNRPHFQETKVNFLFKVFLYLNWQNWIFILNKWIRQFK